MSSLVLDLQQEVLNKDCDILTASIATVSDAISEIQNSLNTESLSKEDMESAIELLEEISTKLEQNKKPKVIKAAFIGSKDFLVNVGANVTATLISAKIQGLF